MRTIGNIGFILLIVGSCAIGSNSIIPEVMVMSGLAMLSYVAGKEQIKIDRT